MFSLLIFISLLIGNINGSRLLLKDANNPGADCSLVRCPSDKPNCIETDNGVQCVDDNNNPIPSNPCSLILCKPGSVCKDLGNGKARCVCAKANKNGKGFAKGKCKRNKKCKKSEGCFCPLVFDPVCCDGETYGNQCQANCECQSNCVKGPCIAPCKPSNVLCPALDDPVCCDDVEYGNQCLADRVCATNCKKGKCNNCVPNELCICTLEYNPICCNGVEYSNKCGAECNCEDLDECTLGQCPKPCKPNDECVCTKEYKPICCNGVTYGNKCEAECQCENLDECSSGECVKKPVFCGGIAGIKCPDRYECFDDPSDKCDPACGGADCGGICVKVWDDGKGNKAQCGGFAGFPCPEGFQCYDDGSDKCSPTCGGADCGGICADVLLQN